MTTLRHLTWFNRINLTVLVAGAAWCAVAGVWGMAVILVLAAAFLVVSIWRAARGAGTDTSRINAVQPYDERERAASTWALALVGQFAIIGLTALLVVQAATHDGRVDLLVAGPLIALALVWAVGIKAAVRRA